MKFHSQFLRIATLPIASLLLILVGAGSRPVRATTHGESSAERYVLEQLRHEDHADLGNLPEDNRRLSATFMVNLLAGRDPRFGIRHEWISITNAVIPEYLNLNNQKIPFAVALNNCRFEKGANFSGSQFPRGLHFINCTFDQLFFPDATIGTDLVLDRCRFLSGPVIFKGMQVERDFIIFDSSFATLETSFENARVGGFFIVDKSTFPSKLVLFNGMRVDGTSQVERSSFNSDAVAFVNAHFRDLFLDESSFNNVDTIDFTRMQADFISFDKVKFNSPRQIRLERMEFKLLSPVNAGQMGFLLSHYNAEFYTDLETSWRTHGYPDEADKIFIAKRIAERQEHCNHFFTQCDSRGAWAWSHFQDKLAGYGKRLQRLLYWSLGFLLIGVFVFRSEKGMRMKDPKDAPHYAGRYNAFWYSLDLFLPIIKLGEADVWTPKDDRRWASLYRKVHIIIGSLFVPIGLAAWTGIIK